jgi:hypothetical protein
MGSPSMDKRSKILTALFFIVVVGSVVATYYRYILRGDISFEIDEEAFQASLLEE